MSALSAGCLADLLAFEAWPEEMQRIARIALEHADIGAEAKEELRDEGREDQHDADQNQFGTVHEHLDAIHERLVKARDRLAPHLVDCEELIATVHTLVTEAMERIEAIPDQLADVKEPAV